MNAADAISPWLEDAREGRAQCVSRRTQRWSQWPSVCLGSAWKSRRTCSVLHRGLDPEGNVYVPHRWELAECIGIQKEAPNRLECATILRDFSGAEWTNRPLLLRLESFCSRINMVPCFERSRNERKKITILVAIAHLKTFFLPYGPMLGTSWIHVLPGACSLSGAGGWFLMWGAGVVFNGSLKNSGWWWMVAINVIFPLILGL